MFVINLFAIFAVSFPNRRSPSRATGESGWVVAKATPTGHGRHKERRVTAFICGILNLVNTSVSQAADGHNPDTIVAPIGITADSRHHHHERWVLHPNGVDFVAQFFQ